MAGTQSACLEEIPGNGTAQWCYAEGTSREAFQGYPGRCLWLCWWLGLLSWVLGAQVSRCSTLQVDLLLRRERNPCLLTPYQVPSSVLLFFVPTW